MLHISPQIRDTHYVIFASVHLECQVVEFLNKESIGFKILSGCYDGVTEKSYIINADHLDSLRDSGLLYCEESILHLTHEQGPEQRRRASLEFLGSGKRLDLGFLVEVSREVAQGHNAWTYDKSSGSYWIAQN